MTQSKWFPQRVGYINIKAPILDAYVGLIEPPNYVLYLGDQARAEEIITERFPEAYLIMSQRQFNKEELFKKYTKCLFHIDCDNGYKVKKGGYIANK